MNNAPILWHSKRQNTAEFSTFGSEFMALWTAVDMIKGLRYKIRMAIPLDGKTSVFCNNEGVVRNSTEPERPLKKKHMAICYHRCHEALAAGFVQLAKDDTKTNFHKTVTGSKMERAVGTGSVLSAITESDCGGRGYYEGITDWDP
jgi:hypothetical protein